MYQNPNLIFGVDTAWAAILRTVITTLHNQSYNAEQKNFLMQVASKMDAHKLPLVIPKFLLHDYTSYTAHRIVNNEFIFNNIDGASDTDTIANLTGTIPNPTVVGDTLSDPFVPIGIFDPDQIPRYKAVLGLGDTLTYAIPAQLLEEREVIPIQEMTVPVNPWASKMMNSLSSDTIHFAAKLLGLQYEVARQGLVSQAIRAKLATCVSGVGMVFHIPLFAIGGVGAINWNDIVPNSRGFLNQIAVMIRGGAINPVAYDGLAYGNTVAENLPYLTRMMPATLAEAANSNLNFSVARLADNSVLVIAFYAFIPPFGAGIAKVPVQMGNDTVFVPQGRSGLTVGNNVLTAGALQFICTHKDPITAFMSDTIAQDDKNAAVYFHTDHAVYSFRDIVATARLPYLAKNNDKRVLKIQFPIEEVEYPNILPPGARFKSYALPANEFVPGITNDVTASEIQDRLEKISKYERENTMLEKKETEKVKESNIANTISTDANSIKDVQATQNEAGVVTTSERDVDALVARNSEEKKDGPKAKTLTKKK